VLAALGHPQVYIQVLGPDVPDGDGAALDDEIGCAAPPALAFVE